MGDRGRDSRLEGLKDLYDLKKKNPSDNATENKFFNAVLAYFLSSRSDHWWCSKDIEPFVRESMMLFSLPAYDHITQYKNRMSKQLSECTYCLDAYQASKAILKRSYEQQYSMDNVARFFQQLEEFDAERIRSSLQQASTELSTIQQSDETAMNLKAISCAMYDVTINPAVLNHEKLDDRLVAVITAMQNTNLLRSLDFRLRPGLFTLMLHHNKILRIFARKQVERCTNSRQELMGHMLDDLKLRTKQLLKYLLSLNPTFAKAEIQPIDEPCNLTDQAGEYWKAFRYISSYVSSPTLLVWLRSSPVNVESLIYSHLEDGSIWFHEVLKVFTTLLSKLKEQFWSSPPTNLSNYTAYVERVFGNRVFRNLMHLLSQGEDKTVVYQKDGTPIPIEKVTVRLNGVLEWIFPYWRSFAHTAIYDKMTSSILEYLFNIFQQSDVPALVRARCVDTGLSIISESITISGHPPLTDMNRYATLILSACLRSDNNTIDAKSAIGQRLIHQIIHSDATVIRNAYLQLYETRSLSQKDESQSLGICDGLWKALCEMNYDFSNKWHVDMFASIIESHSIIGALDIEVIQVFEKSDLLQAKAQFALNSLMVIRNSVHIVLQSVLDRHTSSLSDIFKNETVLLYVLHFLASPDREIRIDSVSMFREAYNEEAFFNCLMKYFQISPNIALDAMIQLMTNMNEMIDHGCNTFGAVTPLFSTLTSLVNALVGNEDSLLFNVITSGDLSLAGDQDRLQKLWSVTWTCIGKTTKVALTWAQNYRPKEVIRAILPVLQIASQMIGTFRTFEQIVQMKDTQISNAQGWSSQSISKLSYNELAKALDPLSDWIFVTSHDVLRLLVPLLIMSLKRLTQTQVKIASDTYDRLMGAATGAAESRVVPNEKEDLFLALSPHDPTNTVFFDESDDEDMYWEATPTDTFKPNFLDSSLLASTSTERSSPSIPLSPIPSAKKLRQPTLAESFAATSKQPSVPTTSSRSQSGQERNQMKLTDYIAKQKKNAIEISDDDSKETNNVQNQPKPSSHKDDFEDDVFDDIDLSQIPEEWFDAESTKVSDEVAGDKATEKIKNRQLELINAAKANMLAKKQSRQPRVHVQPNASTYAVAPSRGGIPGRKLQPPTMGLSKLQALRRDFKTTTTNYRVSSNSPRNTSGQSTQQDSDDSEEESAFAELVSDFDKSKKAHAPEEKLSETLFSNQPRRTIKLIDVPINAGANFLEKKAQMQRNLERKKKVKPSLRGLHKTILSWDVTVEGDVPPGASMSMYKRVPQSFSDIDDYTGVFEPLLLLEVWMQLLRAKEEATESDVIDNCMIESRCNIDEFVDVTIQMTLASARALAVDDLVFIANHFGSTFFNKADPQNKKFIGKGFLSKVKSTVYKRDLADVTVRCYFAPSQMTMLNSLAPKSIWRALKLSSLTTAHREYAALKALEYYDLRDMVLQPKAQPIPPVSEKELIRCMNAFKVNQPQAEAITGALKRQKGFTLIQGPPGTGKTKTILGLVASLISQKANQNGHPSFQTSANEKTTKLTGKLLICAPSNAAVDEIVKRLMSGIAGPDGKMHPKVVRIGKSESINTSVKDVCLETLIEKEVQSLQIAKQNNDKKGNAREKLLEQMRKLKLTLDELDKAMVQAEGDPVKYATINDQRRALMSKKRNLAVSLDEESNKRSEFSRDLELAKQRAKQSILSEADVVSCTLSGSGHEMLTTIGISFETVIIDEAAQSIEISSLIPLKYDCQRCVLVGDPNQLPPTVLSLVASKYSYEQSLFVRLQKSSPEDVFLLSIQYRMHPEISRFPSKLFYESRLKDGPDMDKLTAAEWHKTEMLAPYRFLNILDGKESMGSGKSLYNTHEAEAAITLVDMLANSYPSINFAYRIGVITPYKQQLRELKNRFERQYGRDILNVIDFNTVDGFQGQEKDIIIFSCVRAGNDKGIGFLSDIRRMNVGLTRAKSSLFVLGHSKSLMGSEYWGDLVSDAKRRKLHTDCPLPLFGHRIKAGYHPQNLFKKSASSTTVIPPVVTSTSLKPSRLTEKQPRMDDEMDIDAPVHGSTFTTGKAPSESSSSAGTHAAEEPARLSRAQTSTVKSNSTYNKLSPDKGKRGIDLSGGTKETSLGKSTPSGRKLTIEEYRAKRAKTTAGSQLRESTIDQPTASKRVPPPSTKPKSGLFIPKTKRAVDKNQLNKEIGMSTRERLTLQAEASKAELKRMAMEDRNAGKDYKRQRSEDHKDILDDLLDTFKRT